MGTKRLQRRGITSAQFIYPLLMVCLTLALAGGCDIASTINTDDELQRDNPTDPKSDEAKPPLALIVSHDTTSSVELQKRSIEVRWELDTSRVTKNVEYQYRLAPPTADITNYEWRPSDWMRKQSVSFSMLDESFDDGLHTFQVRARSQDDTTLVQPDPAQLQFAVNAITDRGIAFLPRKIQPSPSGTFSTELWLDEITAEDRVTVIQADISFNAAQFAVDSVTIYKDDRSLLSASDGQITSFTSMDESSDRLTITIGILDGKAANIEGAGPLGEVSFRKEGQGADTTDIRLHADSKFFDPDGKVVPIVEENLDRGILVGD